MTNIFSFKNSFKVAMLARACNALFQGQPGLQSKTFKGGGGGLTKDCEVMWNSSQVASNLRNRVELSHGELRTRLYLLSHES